MLRCAANYKLTDVYQRTLLDRLTSLADNAPLMIKKIAILGSTGSIGTNALRVIEALGPDYKVIALTANTSAKLLAEQTKKFKPEYVALTNPESKAEFCRLAEGFTGKVLTGPESLIEIAALDEADIVITAIVGAAGLPAVLKAAQMGKTLAIANKEPLVIAGQLLMETARQNGATILPVDSEHSAIFQSLQSGRIEEVNKLILTASGGPFRTATASEIENATLQDALAHPTWDMGPKISVDSATMVNKALEVIEAVWLFGIPAEKIEVMVHPESIVHSMVEFVDGSVIAQMSTPDMALPIQYALTYPKRQKGVTNHLKFDELGTLTFEKPNLDVFKALRLGFEVAKQGGSAPVVFNAANEAAVEQFLAEKIRFSMIPDIIEHCICEHKPDSSVSLEEMMEADAWARNEVAEYLAKCPIK